MNIFFFFFLHNFYIHLFYIHQTKNTIFLVQPLILYFFFILIFLFASIQKLYVFLTTK
ncbi:unnamed protein product [Meloidogyne enterolobii]|uniref:Uncharacterized protein n=1 Tax=Meloidogyne enterolobii TaxID=390850 RepID=A0ACB0YL84_MELEN